LRRVCVVGGGPAGVGAALAASEEAAVILLEGSPRLPTPRDGWPELLTDLAVPRLSGGLLDEARVDTRCGRTVTAVGKSLNVISTAGSQRFDSVVVATGTACIPVCFPGSKKPGVHILATEDDYEELREACIGYSRLLLVGAGSTVLGVADRLVRKGIQVTVAAAGGVLRSHFCLGVRAFVLDAAGEVGVSIRDSPIRKAIGSERVEAALVGSEVIPSDAIAVIPPRVASTPAVPAEVGPSGEILVDLEMKSTAPGLFAAGGCSARRTGGVTLSMSPTATARASGLVAGSNATGRRLSLAPAGVSSSRFLGLSIASAGLALAEARAAGLDAMECSGALDGSSTCSIVFEAGTGRILGIQYVGRGGMPTPELFTLIVSKGVLLGDLARLEHISSNDISPILEAASEGMRLWQRS